MLIFSFIAWHFCDPIFVSGFLHKGTKTVPGCAGIGVPVYNYCVPRPANYPVFVFESSVPHRDLRLGPCKGDCGTNDHCKNGLICFHQSEKEEVPKCVGEGSWGKDYYARARSWRHWSQLPPPGIM